MQLAVPLRFRKGWALPLLRTITAPAGRGFPPACSGTHFPASRRKGFSAGGPFSLAPRRAGTSSHRSTCPDYMRFSRICKQICEKEPEQACAPTLPFSVWYLYLLHPYKGQLRPGRVIGHYGDVLGHHLKGQLGALLQAALPAAALQKGVDFLVGVNHGGDGHVVVQSGDKVGDVLGDVHLVEP